MEDTIKYKRIREIYASEERISVPDTIKSFTENGIIEVVLGMK